jgi:hypothetical protein
MVKRKKKCIGKLQIRGGGQERELSLFLMHEDDNSWTRVG